MVCPTCLDLSFIGAAVFAATISAACAFAHANNCAAFAAFGVAAFGGLYQQSRRAPTLACGSRPRFDSVVASPCPALARAFTYNFFGIVAAASVRSRGSNRARRFGACGIVRGRRPNLDRREGRALFSVCRVLRARPYWRRRCAASEGTATGGNILPVSESEWDLSPLAPPSAPYPHEPKPVGIRGRRC